MVAPATFKTINKWAAGISDILALGLLTEAIGKRLPVVALPFVNAAQAAHPAFQGSVDRLRAAGVQLLYGPDVLEVHEPGTGSQRIGLFPWRLTLEAFEANRARRSFQGPDLDSGTDEGCWEKFLYQFKVACGRPGSDTTHREPT